VRRLTERSAAPGGGPAADGNGTGSRVELDRLLAAAEDVNGVRLVTEVVEATDAKALLELSDRVKQTLKPSVVVLGCAVDGRVHLVAGVDPAAVERGVHAGEVVKRAAAVVGGGGGGRDTMAQAGGRSPDKLPDAIAAARIAVTEALTG